MCLSTILTTPGGNFYALKLANLAINDGSRICFGHADVQGNGHSARSSGGCGVVKGLIVVMVNGEGRGVACRVMKPIDEI